VTAEQLERQGQGSVAGYAERAAEATERLGHTLERKGLTDSVRDLESFGRDQPLLFLGASALFGFVATRLLRSASGSDDAASRGGE
jgi:hypothetical protein